MKTNSVKAVHASVLLVLPMAATADHLDVIEFKLKEGCTMAKYLEIVKDFNTTAGKWGYKAEVATPIQSNNLESLYWLGRSKNAETFGKAWDTWRNAHSDANSPESKLSARFGACSRNSGRPGSDTYSTKCSTGWPWRCRWRSDHPKPSR